MRVILGILAASLILLAACSPAPTSTPAAAIDMNTLAAERSGTLTALAASPTSTTTPAPTSTGPTMPPTWTPTHTFTPYLSPTFTQTRATLAVAPTATPTPIPPTPEGGEVRMIFASMRDGEVHLLNPESGATVLVTSDDFANYDAQLSPDGTWAAYVSERYGDADIWMRKIGVDVNVDADALRQLTTSTAADIWPAWSPDGARIVFASDRDEADRFDLYLIDVETKALTRLTASGVNIYPTWAPGPDIVFASNREGGSAMDFDLYRMPSACLNAPETCEGALERITEGDRIDWSPAWSPDGTRIAYASAEAGTSTFQIFVRSLADGGSMQITTGDSLHQFPAWSPDGTRIAFVGIWSGARDIFIVPAGEEAPPVERLTTGLGVESLRGWVSVPGQ